MKKNIYVVHSLDGKIVRTYKNLKGAMNFAQRLVAMDDSCYFSQWNDIKLSMQTCLLFRRDFHYGTL